jgi:hypothetical protein
MQTRGSGLWYEHDHLRLLNVDRDINLGFWSAVLSHGQIQDFKLFKYEACGFDTIRSIQSNALMGLLERMGSLQTA